MTTTDSKHPLQRYYYEVDGSWPYVVDRFTGERIIEIVPTLNRNMIRTKDRAKWVTEALNEKEAKEPRRDHW